MCGFGSPADCLAVDVIANFSGMIGVLCVAIPAAFASRYAYSLTRLMRLEPHPQLAALRQQLEQRLSQGRDGWTRWKSNLLYAGLGLSFLSYLLPFLKAVGILPFSG
jgi:hypothetical protein